MTYTEFKEKHDKLICNIIFTETNKVYTMVEELERLRLDYEKHFNKLWAEL